MDRSNRLAHKIQKFSKFLNIILIMAIIWYTIRAVIEGLIIFVTIETDFILLLVGNTSGVIVSALILIVLMQLRIIIKTCENLTPFHPESSNVLQRIVYLELEKFLYVLFSLLIQEKLNFAFDYLIVAAVFLILIDAFKCANQDFKEIRILHKLTKWMSIILLIRKIIWIISLVFLIFGSVMILSLSFDAASEVIINEQFLVLQ